MTDPFRRTMRWCGLLIAGLTLAACATPAVQPRLTPPPGFTGPRLEADALIMDDGARMPLTRWTPTSGERPWAVIVALHGVTDSRASFHLAGPWWAEHGIETWAYDQRGHGDAQGQKGLWGGTERMAQDARNAVALARAAHPDALIVLAGESMGGAIGIVAFADSPPPADRLVLMGPAVWGWSAQDPLNRYSLRLTAGLMGSRTITPPEFIARDHLATDNRIELYRMSRDPASIVENRFDALYGLVELMEDATQALARVTTPTLFQYGAEDHVVPRRAIRQALDRAGPRPNLRTAYYPNGWHILNRDLEAEAVFADIEAWLRDPDAPLPSGAPPIPEDLRPSR